MFHQLETEIQFCMFQQTEIQFYMFHQMETKKHVPSIKLQREIMKLHFISNFRGSDTNFFLIPENTSVQFIHM